jgi:hypothetical protein
MIPKTRRTWTHTADEGEAVQTITVRIIESSCKNRERAIFHGTVDKHGNVFDLPNLAPWVIQQIESQSTRGIDCGSIDGEPYSFGWTIDPPASSDRG